MDDRKRAHIHRMLDFLPRGQNVAHRAGQEISPGLHYDPISEARSDYDGTQSMLEAEMMKVRNIIASISFDGASVGAGSNEALVNISWDSALEIAAHICERRNVHHSVIAEIRSMKKEK